MMRKVFCLAALEIIGLIFAGLAFGQTVSPIIAEGGKGKARGEFVVTNNGVVPMVTTVEASLFRLTPEGKSVYVPLDGTVQVKLAETSAKVGPRQTHAFSYEVQCFQTPCLVAFLPRMVTGLHTSEGIQVGIIIPHSVYLCDKAKGCRAQARKLAGIPDGK
jgi:hypothetical protein